MDTAEGEIIDDVMTPTSNLFDHYIINISIAYIIYTSSDEFLFDFNICIVYIHHLMS